MGSDEEESTAREKRNSVQDAAKRRSGERAETVEGILSDVRSDLGDQNYPVSSEELGAYYADDPIDLPNETESVGSVFDRLNNSYEDADEAYEAFASEYGSDDPGVAPDDANAAEAQWEEGRSKTQQPGDQDAVESESYESTDADARRRAREAQAEEGEEDEEPTE